MRIALRILILLALLIVLPLGAIVVIEPEFRLDEQRQWIARLATTATGREVHFDGEMRLSLGRHGRLRVQKVTVANPDWANREHLFQADEADIVIDLADLLRGILAIEDVRLLGAAVALEVSSNGQRSWRPAAADDGDQSSTESRWSTRRLFRLHLEQASLDDVRVAYESPSRQHRLTLDRFRQRNVDDLLLLDGHGELDGLALRVAGNAGTLISLLNGTDIQTDLSISLDDVVLKATGGIGDVSTFEDVAISASLRGPDLAHILHALGIPYRHPGDVDATLEVADEAQGLSWEAAGRVGGLRLVSQGAMRTPGMLDGLDATFDVSGSDLSVLAGVFGEDGLPQQGYRLRGQVIRDGKRLQLAQVRLETGGDRIAIDATVPQFPTMAAADAEVAVRLKDPRRYLIRTGSTVPIVGALSVDATLGPMTGQNDRILDLDASWGKHKFEIDGRFGARGDLADSEIRFVANGPSLPVVPASGDAPPGPYSLAGKLSIDGQRKLQVETTDGRIATTRLAVEGRLGRLPGFDDLDLSLKVEGPSVREVAGWAMPTSLHDLPFSIESRVSGTGLRPALRNARVTLGTMQLQTDGVLNLADKGDGSDLRFQIAAASLPFALNGTAEGHSLLPAGPYTASGRVSARDAAFQLEDVEVKGEELDVSLSAIVPLDGGFRRANLELQAEVSRLAAIAPEFDGYTAPDEPLNIALKIAGASDALTIEEGSIELGDAKLRLAGALPIDARQTTPVELQMTLTAARLSDLGRAGGFVVEDDPLRVETTLRYEGGKATLDPMKIELGDARIDARLHVENRSRPFVELSIDAQGIDLRRIRREVSETAHTGAANEDQASSLFLIPEAVVDLSVLETFDGALQFKSKDMYVADPRFDDSALIRQAQVSASLDTGKLKLDRIELDGDRGEANGHGTIAVHDAQTLIDAKIQARSFRFSMLAAGESLEGLPEHDIDLQLSTRGRSYRDLGIHLNGSLRLVGGAGVVSHQGVARDLGPFFGDLISRLNPLTRTDSHTGVECTAAAISVTDGVVDLDPGFVLRSAKLDIAAMGTIDLHTEGIDVQMHSAPREGIGISAAGIARTFVKVGGTLSRPGIALDTPKALISGTAAVATSGLSILATTLLDRLATASNPCQTLIEQADLGRSKPTLNPIDGLGNALRKTLQQKGRSDKPKETESVLDLVN